ncbi:hypothetical protein B0O99DRAFT_631250 [Bisporella sp. PMI_857]|nr:hypothetical protein B0O99DRAFT_631250 [Bisporella sp. PMI_857]
MYCKFLDCHRRNSHLSNCPRASSSTMTEPNPSNNTDAPIHLPATRQQSHSTHRGIAKQIDESNGKLPPASHDHNNFKDKDIAAPSTSKYETWGGGVFTPQYTNQKYSDDSITTVVVLNVIPSAKSVVPNVEREETHDSKVTKITNIFQRRKEKKDSGKTGLMKVVFMPMRDYNKWFAKDNDGVYIGTGPSREWNEDELEEKFGAYRPAKGEQGINAGSIDRMLNAKARGL